MFTQTPSCVEKKRIRAISFPYITSFGFSSIRNCSVSQREAVEVSSLSGIAMKCIRQHSSKGMLHASFHFYFLDFSFLRRHCTQLTTWHKWYIRVYFSFPLCLIMPTNHLRVTTHHVVNVVSSSHILMHRAARNPHEGTFCFVLLSSHIIFIYLSRRPIINENSRLHVCFEVSLGFFFSAWSRPTHTNTFNETYVSNSPPT